PGPPGRSCRIPTPGRGGSAEERSYGGILLVLADDAAPVDLEGLTGEAPHPVDEHLTFTDFDALVERGDIAVVEAGHGDLRDDRPGVDARVDDEQGGSGDLDAVLECALWPADAGKGGRQSRMGVEDAPTEAPQEHRAG